MRKLVTAFAFVAVLIFGLSLQVAATTTFTVSPWAFACGTTHTGNPATATDPGGTTCPTDKTDHSSYCPDGELAGSASSSYAAGKLTLTKLGPTCDFMSSGATIGGLSTLHSASADCLTPATCNPGGNLRLNIVDAAGGFHFVGGHMDSAGHIEFDPMDSAGKVIQDTPLKSIDLIADNAGTVVLDHLAFAGEAIPAPTPTPTAHPSPTATPVPVLAQTGGGLSLIENWWIVALALGLIATGEGVALLVIRRRRS